MKRRLAAAEHAHEKTGMLPLDLVLLAVEVRDRIDAAPKKSATPYSDVAGRLYQLLAHARKTNPEAFRRMWGERWAYAVEAYDSFNRKNPNALPPEEDPFRYQKIIQKSDEIAAQKIRAERGNIARTILEYAPVTGNLIALGEAIAHVAEGEFGDAALAALGALGGGVGKGAGAAIKAATKSKRASTASKAKKADDTAEPPATTQKNKTSSSTPPLNPRDHDLSTASWKRQVEGTESWKKHRRGPPGGTAYKEHLGQPLRHPSGAPVLVNGRPVRVGDTHLAMRDGRPGYIDFNGRFHKIHGPKVPKDEGGVVQKVVETHKDGGRVIRITRDGKSHNIYFNKYNLPELPGYTALWIGPKDIFKRHKAHNRIMLNYLKSHSDAELTAMGLGHKIKGIRGGLSLDDLHLKAHHDYQVGKLVLVDKDVHEAMSHFGGFTIWGQKAQKRSKNAK